MRGHNSGCQFSDLGARSINKDPFIGSCLRLQKFALVPYDASKQFSEEGIDQIDANSSEN